MGKAAKLLNHIAMALGKTIEPLVTTVTWGSSDTQYDRPASQKTGGMTNLASLYPLHVPEADKNSLERLKLQVLLFIKSFQTLGQCLAILSKYLWCIAIDIS